LGRDEPPSKGLAAVGAPDALLVGLCALDGARVDALLGAAGPAGAPAGGATTVVGVAAGGTAGVAGVAAGGVGAAGVTVTDGLATSTVAVGMGVMTETVEMMGEGGTGTVGPVAGPVGFV